MSSTTETEDAVVVFTKHALRAPLGYSASAQPLRLTSRKRQELQDPHPTEPISKSAMRLFANLTPHLEKLAAHSIPAINSRRALAIAAISKSGLLAEFMGRAATTAGKSIVGA